ncbi:MAG: hypothetical protein HY725_17930 [Candidatus Rokubacteria bacterium]|nr:hypothetical protein [Candidatus Rokubacteria bacterium]
MKEPPVNLAELLVDLVAEALNFFIQRAESFGDHLDLRPQAFGDHVEMAASLCGAGLDFLTELPAEFLSKLIGAGLDILADVLSKPIEPGVKRVLNHG